jgi:hypothetical protein
MIFFERDNTDPEVDVNSKSNSNFLSLSVLFGFKVAKKHKIRLDQPKSGTIKNLYS